MTAFTPAPGQASHGLLFDDPPPPAPPPGRSGCPASSRPPTR